MIDFYSEGICRVWLRLDDDCRGDLDLVRCRPDRIGTEPEWFAEERRMNGLDGVISPEWRLNRRDRWIVWALGEGLCPGQPFLVEILPPEWHRTSYEYDEWDVSWTWEIIARAPVAAKVTAGRWGRFLARRVENMERLQTEAAERHRAATTDLEAMSIYIGSFWSRGWMDDQSPPDGVIYRLCSRHGHLNIEGRAHGADAHERAHAALLLQASLRLPHIEPAVIRSLRTRW